jgi:hypothetical protein
MEIVTALLSKYGYAVGMIALFCWSLISAFKRVPALKHSAHFNAWLPLLPAILGGGLGAGLPWIFPPDDHAGLRAFIGVIAGLNAGAVVAVIRRVARLVVAKKAGETTANTIFAETDETGKTLAPFEENPPKPPQPNLPV